jgi:hypothetical protein
MALSLAIALNVALAVGLLAGLAHTMSHPRKLTPHVSKVGVLQMEALPAHEEDEQIAA